MVCGVWGTLATNLTLGDGWDIPNLIMAAPPQGEASYQNAPTINVYFGVVSSHEDGQDGVICRKMHMTEGHIK